MRRFIIIVAVIILWWMIVWFLVVPAHADGYPSWDKESKVLWWVYTSQWALDLGYTREQAANQDRYYETGMVFVLSEHPSVPRVNNVFLVGYALMYLIAAQLPEEGRDFLLATGAVCHLQANIHSEAIGMQLNWKF